MTSIDVNEKKYIFDIQVEYTPLFDIELRNIRIFLSIDPPFLNRFKQKKIPSLKKFNVKSVLRKFKCHVAVKTFLFSNRLNSNLKKNLICT